MVHEKMETRNGPGSFGESVAECLFVVENRLGNIDGAIFGLLKDPAHIFPHNSNAEQFNAAEEEN